MNMESHILEYRSAAFEVCQCSVEVCRTLNVVIATEVRNGLEVTENVETIANEAVRQFELDPRRLFFIERYYPETPFENASLVEFCLDEGAELRNPRRFELPPSVLHKIKPSGTGPDFSRFNDLVTVDDESSTE
ncbi:hypothetical protein EQG79_29535 [Spirosoma sordidisoli]|uniref:Uncharacterized protein n=2 Tax=Spirosoma sordidisoli TaxID=2502893 RepID=A0A4Q2UCL6_9BACT|nr:hypothetical protein EQG79_29535 [Spirosoma sordidisoli]